MPYILWVSAYNTTFLLGYLLLDLVFFPSPLSKSVYSPTSKLKVQPEQPILRPDKRGSRGPDGVAPPSLLDAVNQNGLVLFLLVSCSTLVVLPVGGSLKYIAGKYCDRSHQLVDADDVYFKYLGVPYLERIFFRSLARSVVVQRQKVVAVLRVEGTPLPVYIDC